MGILGAALMGTLGAAGPGAFANLQVGGTKAPDATADAGAAGAGAFATGGVTAVAAAAGVAVPPDAGAAGADAGADACIPEARAPASNVRSKPNTVGGAGVANIAGRAGAGRAAAAGSAAGAAAAAAGGAGAGAAVWLAIGHTHTYLAQQPDIVNCCCICSKHYED